jgi:hypothetical protein
MMKDHRQELLKRKQPRKYFVICRECLNKEKEKGVKIGIWWWAKSECSYCKRTGAELYPKGLVIASIRKPKCKEINS